MNDMATTRMLLTTAVLAAVAALMTAPAHAYFADVEGGGPSDVVSVPAQTQTGLDPAIQTAIQARQASLSGDVDESRFAGDAAAAQSTTHSLGHGVPPTGDVDESRFAGDVARASELQPAQSPSSTTDVDWTWIGLGSGLAAFLALAMASLYLTARQRRGGVALP